jgi:uncharacterized protein
MAILTSDAELKQVTSRLVQSVDPEGIVLFGSRARGDASTSSDYDIALVFSSIEQIRPGLRQAHRALWPRPFAVDLVGFAKERFLEGQTALAREVLKEGLWLYQKK